jgi:hypothetical protein
VGGGPGQDRSGSPSSKGQSNLHRFEHALEWDVCSLADGPDILLVSLEEEEGGLVGVDEDRAQKLELVSTAAKLGRSSLCPAHCRGELALVDPGPKALDQVSLGLLSARHERDVTPAVRERNRVFP